MPCLSPSFIYVQETGALYERTFRGNYRFVTRGYAGREQGRNNPQLEALKNVGPIPRGCWEIGEAVYSAVAGPVTVVLTPHPETALFGRSAFRIHGNNAKDDASRGCIILPRSIRSMIAKRRGQTLLVRARSLTA